MLRLTIFLARACNLIAGFSFLALIVVAAMHFAPIVVHTGENGEANVYTTSWGLVAVFAALSVGFWLAARGLAVFAVYVLMPDEDLYDDYL